MRPHGDEPIELVIADAREPELFVDEALSYARENVYDTSAVSPFAERRRIEICSALYAELASCD